MQPPPENSDPSGGHATVHPADVAVTFEQAEGGALLCGGDICNVWVKQ
jgi:hypothetical protein